MCKQAIALEPEYPVPYAFLSLNHWNDVFLGWSKSPRESMKKAVELAQRCIALDGSSSLAHRLLSWTYLMQRKYDKAILEANNAIPLDPNSSNAHAFLGIILNYTGRSEKAIIKLEQAIRLNPFPPSWYFFNLGMAYRETGRYEEAIAACNKALRIQPKNIYALLILAATYSLMNRQEEARATGAKVLKINPGFSLGHLSKSRPHIDQANTARFIEALRKAGLK